MALPHQEGRQDRGTVPDVAPRRIAAGIVVFQPEPATLLRLIDTVLPDVAGLILFLNSVIDPLLQEAVAQHDRVTIIEAKTNLGIGAALNIIGLAAALADCDDVVLFDQDSQPARGMIARLVGAQARLLAAGETPAIVAPRMVAATPDSKAPTYRFRPETAVAGTLRAADFVPTSGSLVRLDVLRRIGFFRADYFIDGIDLEWSFRAWARGFSCWVALDCPMPHAVGTGVIAWPRIRFRMPKQRPFRMYCTVRNTLYGFRLRHVPTGWKLRQAAYLPVQILAYGLHHRLAWPVLRLLAAGVVDGVCGRLGVPRGVPDGRSQSSTPQSRSDTQETVSS